MIQINNHEISGVYDGLKEIIAVYSGLHLVWEKLSTLLSCYSNGYWIDDYPWTDETNWQD